MINNTNKPWISGQTQKLASIRQWDGLESRVKLVNKLLEVVLKGKVVEYQERVEHTSTRRDALEFSTPTVKHIQTFIGTTNSIKVEWFDAVSYKYYVTITIKKDKHHYKIKQGRVYDNQNIKLSESVEDFIKQLGE